jgi:hypothetical protein
VKLFGLRIRSWLFLGIGFLVGSAVGKGPFERVMEMVNELRGGGGAEFRNGFRPNTRDTVADAREAVGTLSN